MSVISESVYESTNSSDRRFIATEEDGLNDDDDDFTISDSDNIRKEVAAEYDSESDMYANSGRLDNHSESDNRSVSCSDTGSASFQVRPIPMLM